MIPECKLHFAYALGNGTALAEIAGSPVKDIKARIRDACGLAVNQGAFIGFLCDTPAQAKHAAKWAAKHLPNYRRVALERTYEAAAPERGKLS